MNETIPYMSVDPAPPPQAVQFPLTNILNEIISRENMAESVDYVIAHLEHSRQRARHRKHREDYIRSLTREIADGSFRVTDYRTIHVVDGIKPRVVQAPTVYQRCGVHAVMAVVEKYVYPTLIRKSAASIKGRGMHWLHHVIEDEIKADPDTHRYYYQSDIRHYYDNIDQEIMKRQIGGFISDPVILPILHSFVELLPQGLSKGLQSSQCFANIHLNEVDHVMEAASNGHYDRYCDDVAIFAKTKTELWELRDLYVAELAKLGLHIKPDEAVRPLSEGLDHLGYVQYPTHSLLRKRTKQKAARKLARVKSRKRRQEIIGSFKGMACHADCKHLFFKLTRHRMRKFSEMGLTHIPKDGKKRFNCDKLSLGQIANRPIIVLDFERGIHTKHGDDRYLVKFHFANEITEYKFYTDSSEMKDILEQVSQLADGFPFETTIQQVPGTGSLRIFRFT